MAKKRKRDPRWRIGDVLLSAGNTLNLVRDTCISEGRCIYKMYGLNSSSPTWRYSYNYRKVGHHDGTVASWSKYPQVLKRSGNPTCPDNLSRSMWANVLKRGPAAIAHALANNPRAPMPYPLVVEETPEEVKFIEINRANKRKIRRRK